jgi:hypothetical protein
MSSVGDFANVVWENYGSPADPSVSYILGWANSHLGQLNVHLNTEFCISGSDFSPSFGNAESGIYEEMFNVDYYESRARDAIHGVLSTSGFASPWTRVSEGDTTIQKANPNDTMRAYISLKRDSSENLNRLLAAYKRNLFAPHQVVPPEAQ